MRSFFIMTAVCVAACGGKTNPKTESVPFDPELADLCIGQATPAEEACIRETDDRGRMRWRLPLGESPEWQRLRGIPEKGHPAYAAVLTGLIRKSEQLNCGGDGCDRVRRNAACEAQMARLFRAEAHAAGERWREAFLDIAAILRGGPSHFGYRRVPDLFGAVEAHLPDGLVPVCMNRYERPGTREHRPHWRPYTKDDPAPKW